MRSLAAPLALAALASCRAAGGGGLDAAALQGTSWVLARAPFALVAGASPTLEVGPEGVSGSTGCNRYFGSLALSGGALAVGPLGATRRACGGELDRQEREYLALLAGARTAERSGPSLILRGPSPDSALAFEPADR